MRLGEGWGGFGALEEGVGFFCAGAANARISRKKPTKEAARDDTRTPAMMTPNDTMRRTLFVACRRVVHPLLY